MSKAEPQADAPPRERTLRIGVATVEEMKARTLAIARGDLKPGRDEPKVWVPSMEALGKILSGRNTDLLDRIRRQNPPSLQALSELTGRAVPSLSRTLRTMQRYGLVTLERGAHGRVRPVVPYERVDVTLEIGTDP